MKYFLILASFLIFSFLGIQESFASSEGNTKEIMIDTVVHKIIDGKPVIEKQQTKAILYTIPQPQLQGCERTERTIPWSARLQNNSKILPDIQTEIDSGKNTLCVTIVLPFIGPEYGDEPEDLGTVLSNFESISQFVMENGGIVERKRVNFSEYIHRHMTYVDASIPTSLIPELTDKEEVVVIDKYGKYPKIPSYLVHGYDSKIRGVDMQEEIVSLYVTLEEIPMWPDGWPDKTSYPTKEQIAQRSEERKSETQIMQEPIIALLEANNAEIIDVLVGINVIIADVPTSLLPELENLDAIEYLDYRDLSFVLTSHGSSASTEKDDSVEVPGKTMLNITVSDNTAKLEFSGNFEELKKVIIPNEISDMKLDVTINDVLFDDYKLSKPHDDATYIILNAFTEPETYSDAHMFEERLSYRGPPILVGDYEVFHLSPLKQIKSGVPVDEIQCKDNLVLLQKHNGSPACIKESTINKLIERNWTNLAPKTCPDGYSYNEILFKCVVSCDDDLVYNGYTDSCSTEFELKYHGFCNEGFTYDPSSHVCYSDDGISQIPLKDPPRTPPPEPEPEPKRTSDAEMQLHNARKSLQNAYQNHVNLGPYYMKDVVVGFGTYDDTLIVDIASKYTDSDSFQTVKQEIQHIVGNDINVDYVVYDEPIERHIETVIPYLWNKILHQNKIDFAPKEMSYFNNADGFAEHDKVCSPLIASNGTEFFISSTFNLEPFEITGTIIEKIRPDGCHKIWKTDVIMQEPDRVTALWLENEN